MLLVEVSRLIVCVVKNSSLDIIHMPNIRWSTTEYGSTEETWSARVASSLRRGGVYGIRTVFAALSRLAPRAKPTLSHLGGRLKNLNSMNLSIQ